MSPATMDNFVHSLVEMARATEELPQVQAECERLREQHLKDGDIIVERELKIIDLHNEIDGLRSQIRSLEVERDDYGFRALAADDRANAFADALRSAQALVGAALKAAEPEPVVIETPTVPVVEAQMASSSATPSGDIGQAAPEPVDIVASGQSEPGPTAIPVPTGSERQEPISASYSVPEAVTSVTEVPSGPYTGKLYMREPGYINRFDWLAGGGTAEAYDWRPGNPLPDGYVDYGAREPRAASF